MSAPSSIEQWDRFWHTPADPRMAALFRIGIGLVAAFLLWGQAPFVELWWGDHGVCPPELGEAMRAPTSWTLLEWLPSDYLRLYWGVAIAHALLLSAGVFHRFNAVMLFVWLVSFQNRCPMVNDGGDTTIRLMVFFVIFLDASRMWALWPKKADAPTTSGFAVRLIQMQTVLIFGVAGLEKWLGPAWWTGDAMFWVAYLDDFGNRLPFGQLMTAMPWVSWPMSVGTLLVEFLVPVTVWMPRFRVASVVVAIALHVALEVSMYIYAFEFAMMLGWMMFLRWPAGHQKDAD